MEELMWHESTTVKTTPYYATLHKCIIVGIRQEDRGHRPYKKKKRGTTTTPNIEIKMPVISNEHPAKILPITHLSAGKITPKT